VAEHRFGDRGASWDPWTPYQLAVSHGQAQPAKEASADQPRFSTSGTIFKEKKVKSLVGICGLSASLVLPACSSGRRFSVGREPMT
jgi:hypothetical protein